MIPIEESVLDEILADSRFKAVIRSTPEALEHLLLALTALHLTRIGVGVMYAEQRSYMDPHWDRRLSYLSIGWRQRRPQDQRGWQDAGPFVA